MTRGLLQLLATTALSVLLLAGPSHLGAEAFAPTPFPPPPADPVCEPVDRMPLEGRASPYDSATVAVGDAVLKLCYGRPSARGRIMIGGDDVPFGQPWRTGANEPTTLHTTAAIVLGDTHLDPGSYSLYTIPGPETWEVILNRATDRWGIPIDDGVRAQEVASVTVPRERPGEHVETLTFSFHEEGPGAVELRLEWEDFRIAIPIGVH
jgi:hypothetical protein